MGNGSIGSKIKEKPVISVMITLGIIAGSVVSISRSVPVVDSWNVTHYEMQIQLNEYSRKFETHVADASTQFAELKRSIDYNATYEKCTGLRTEMRMIESALYEARQSNGNGRADYIHELERDLEELSTAYSSLECARVLS